MEWLPILRKERERMGAASQNTKSPLKSNAGLNGAPGRCRGFASADYLQAMLGLSLARSRQA